MNPYRQNLRVALDELAESAAEAKRPTTKADPRDDEKVALYRAEMAKRRAR